MIRYTVYFEFYGRKMKQVVEAKTDKEAKEIIQNRLIFHRLEPNMDDITEKLKGKSWEDIFGKFDDIFKK